MNKAELGAAVAEKLGLTDKAAIAVQVKAVDALFEVITNEMYQERPVKIHGFGDFTVTKREERLGRNPQSGEAITIGAKNAAKFKPAKALKAAIQD
jgi:DNA-binding protein HU-beta